MSAVLPEPGESTGDYGPLRVGDTVVYSDPEVPRVLVTWDGSTGFTVRIHAPGEPYTLEEAVEAARRFVAHVGRDQETSDA